MSAKDQFGRGARSFLARLQNLRSRNAPDAPALGLRDPWPGDPSRGARLVKGEMEFAGAVLMLAPGVFQSANATALLRAHAHGFTWLRDLRALGTDAARTRARALVSEFMDAEGLDAMGYAPDVMGARLAAWLGHYDFFAASADDDFRQRLMSRLVTDARSLSAALPAELLDQRALGGGVFAEQEKGGADVVLGEDFEELGGPLGVGAVVEGEGEFVGLARGDEGGAEELGGWPEGGVGVSAAGETDGGSADCTVENCLGKFHRARDSCLIIRHGALHSQCGWA